MTKDEITQLGLFPGGCFANRYEVVRKLGVGGMAVVFHVLDLSLNREPLALKLISSRGDADGESSISRFRNEVLITRKLSHPNIVRTYDFAELSNGTVYMTMEFVDGNSLEKELSERKDPFFKVENAIRVLLAIAEGIQYAHANGVIHRDLKPGNVLISHSGEIKVTDFGLAQSLLVNERLTLTGECVGTPAYMSPEQVLGKPADKRCDIYALGMLAYELATGKPPFLKKGWFELANQIVNEPVPSLLGDESDIPQWYDTLVQNCTNKDPDDRFDSVQEVIEAIRSCSTKIIVPPTLSLISAPAAPALVNSQPHNLLPIPLPPDSWTQPEKTGRRLAPLVSVICLIILLAGIGITRYHFGSRKSTSQDAQPLHSTPMIIQNLPSQGILSEQKSTPPPSVAPGVPPWKYRQMLRQKNLQEELGRHSLTRGSQNEKKPPLNVPKGYRAIR